MYEGCLKLINLDTAAIAIWGDVHCARSVIEAFRESLQLTGDRRAAFERAVRSNGPYDSDCQICLLMAFPDSPAPVLLSFNHAGNEEIIEHQDGFLVQLGSIKPGYKSLSGQMIAQLKLFAAEPHKFLVNTLAFRQSYGVHDSLLEHGVGGAFCGLFVGERSIEWQKDILFCRHNGLDPNLNIVSSIIRDHVLVLRSTFSNSCRYFADPFSCSSFEDWKAKWWDPAFDFVSHGRFDFVVLLNSRSRIITVIEMLKHQSSEHLRITPLPGTGPLGSFKLDCAFSPLLSQAMNEPIADKEDGSIPFKFNWFPHPVPACHVRGLGLAELGRYEEALEEFRKVLEMEPGNVKALNIK